MILWKLSSRIGASSKIKVLGHPESRKDGAGNEVSSKHPAEDAFSWILHLFGRILGAESEPNTIPKVVCDLRATAEWLRAPKRGWNLDWGRVVALVLSRVDPVYM